MYPSADLPCLFVGYFINNLDQALFQKLLSQYQHLLLVQLVQLFLHLMKCHNPYSRDALLLLLLSHVTVTPSLWNTIECLDSILPSLTDLIYSSLTCVIFPHCFKSALVTPTAASKYRHYANSYIADFSVTSICTNHHGRLSCLKFTSNTWNTYPCVKHFRYIFRSCLINFTLGF